MDNKQGLESSELLEYFFLFTHCSCSTLYPFFTVDWKMSRPLMSWVMCTTTFCFTMAETSPRCRMLQKPTKRGWRRSRRCPRMVRWLCRWKENFYYTLALYTCNRIVFSVLKCLHFVMILASPFIGEEELEVEEEEENKGPDLKLASRRDMYSICQSVGLG